MASARVSRRGRRRGSTGRGARQAGGEVSSFLTWGLGPGSVEAGCEHGDLGFPGGGGLGRGDVRELRGRAFCARSSGRCRPGRLRVCRHARAAASAAAASASSDEAAVTWVDVMDRIAWRRAAVKDSSSAVTFAGAASQGAGGGVPAMQRGGLAGADRAWVAVSQAQASWMTSRGQPERRTGPDVRLAPAMVDLSSPKVVSAALHRVR